MLRNGVADMMIRVHDTGIGMEPAFISRIFRPFEQEIVETCSEIRRHGPRHGHHRPACQADGRRYRGGEPAKPDTSNTLWKPSAPGNNKPSKPGGGKLNTNGAARLPQATGQGSIANTTGSDSGKTGAGVIGEQGSEQQAVLAKEIDDSTVQEVAQQPQNTIGERQTRLRTPGRKTSLSRRFTMHWKPMSRDSNGKTYYRSNLKDANGNDVCISACTVSTASDR